MAEPREFVEVKTLITVRYDPAKIDPGDMEWAIDKMGECDVISNIGYNWDDFHTSSQEVSRTTVTLENADD